MIEVWYYKDGKYYCGSCGARRAMHGENGLTMRGFASKGELPIDPLSATTRCVDCEAREESERQRWGKKENK